MTTGKTKLAFLGIASLVIAVGFLVYKYKARSLVQSLYKPHRTIDVRTESINSDTNKARLKEFSYSQLQMAMQLRITVWCDSQDHAEEACKLAFDRAAELVKVFSDYDPKSESRRLTRSKIGQPIKVSDHLFHALAFSKVLNEKTNGAFDPTASVLIRLWRTARKDGALPESNAIEKAIEHVGLDKFQIDLNKKTVTLLASAMDLDFGGIAKGYIGDQVIKVLQENGIEIGCYEAGGDIVLGSSPPGKKGWAIEVGHNDDGSVKTLELANCGVSTSGDTQQFVEIDGRRYSHVIDPRTGIGITTGQAAYVVAPSGMESDALATVGCVLNEADFQKLLDGYDNTIGWSNQ